MSSAETSKSSPRRVERSKFRSSRTWGASEGITRNFDKSFRRLQYELPRIFKGQRTTLQKLSLIMAMACIAGFLIDLTAVVFPLSVLSAQWRLEVFRFAGDRSIVLLIGMALLLLCLQYSRFLKRVFSRLCLLLGVAYLLTSIVVFRDTIAVRDDSTRNIDLRAEQAVQQIKSAEAPSLDAPQISSEQLQQVTQQIFQQAQGMKSNATQQLLKTLFMTVGNLLVAGMVLIAMSRVD
jgi:hypothetical protein